MKEDTILKVLPWDVRSIIQKEKLEFEYLQEIRLREGKPLIFLYHDTEVIPGAKARRPYLVTANYAQTECQFRYCGTAIPFLTVRSTAR